MWNFLDKLRQKNDAQKLVVAVGLSALITFVITATWIAAINVSDKSEEDQVEAKSKDEVTPISNIGDQVGELKGMFSEIFSEFKSTKEVFEELPAMMEEYENVDTENATNSTTTIEIESNVE